ncbi:unnamed protein product [Gadus morhua 'NCC']
MKVSDPDRRGLPACVLGQHGRGLRSQRERPLISAPSYKVRATAAEGSTDQRAHEGGRETRGSQTPSRGGTGERVEARRDKGKPEER